MYGTNYAQIIFQPSTSSVTVIVNLSDHVGILDHWRWMSLVCWNYLVSSLLLDNRFLVLLLEQMMTKLKRRNKNKSSRIRCSLVWSGLTMHWWYADDALMICWWCTDDALMICWWCTADALMMCSWCADDALMMHSWCADETLMMHWWCADDALMMHWWCTDDGLMMRW